MKLFASSDLILDKMTRRCPELRTVLDAVREDITWSKREIVEYQAAVLYVLARQYNREGANILEIGTALGYSAAVLARAAPQALVTTLNPKEGEWQRAASNLAGPPYGNVVVVPAYSWDYLAQYGEYDGPRLDMVFVDGDHGEAARDFGWWDWLAPGGLMLFHDYTPEGVKRSCQPVWEAVNVLADALDREFDVLVVNEKDAGMAGFYQTDGAPLPEMDIDGLLWHLGEDGKRWEKGAGNE